MKKIFYLILFCILFGLNSPVMASSAHHKAKQIDMLPWKDVNSLIPRYTKFVVRDVETGEEFKVQRRAGNRHADVQPLSAADTKKMKRIYNGKWSWKRRAIVVIYKDQQIAASMHGMPHGAGALKNNFPGHFCIHFYGSRTHRSGNMDLSHKLMILKAAGQLNSYIGSCDPYELADAFIAGLKQQDPKIINSMSVEKRNWNKGLRKIENVRLTRITELPIEEQNAELEVYVPIEVDWFIKGTGRQKYKGDLHFVRLSPIDSWKVDTKHFLIENRLITK